MFYLLLIAAAAAPLLHLDRSRDSEQPCSPLAALSLRLQALDPASLTDSSRRDALEVQLDWDGAAWQLRLLRGDRSTALERKLALGRADCALVAESAALVIDRYLAALREPPRAPAPSNANPVQHRPSAAHDERARASPATASAPTPIAPEAKPREIASALPPLPPQPAPIEAPPSIAPRPNPAPPPESISPIADTAILSNLPPGKQSAASNSESAPQAGTRELNDRSAVPVAGARDSMNMEGEKTHSIPAPPSFTASLGPAALLGLPGDLRAGAWLAADYSVSVFSMRALAMVGASSSESERQFGAPVGSISATTAHLGIAPGVCQLRWALFCGHLYLGARFIFGSSSGPQVFQQENSALVLPELGGEFSLERKLSDRFQLRLTLLGTASLGQASLQLQGGPARQLSVVDLALGLLLGYQLF